MQGPLMPRGRKCVVFITAAALWTSGVAWLALHYFGRVQGPFGPEENPAEAWLLRAHGAAAFVSLWVLGMLWAVHVTPAWDRARRRWSGGLTFAAAVLLAATGYLLYYVGDEALRAGASLIHWTLGIAALLVFALHGLRFGRRPKSNPDVASGGSLP